MSRVNYKKYGMSQARYEELRAFARQYNELATEHKRLLDGTGPVKENAIKAADIKTKLEIIDKCIDVACSDMPMLKPYLLKNVTEGTPYCKMQVPLYERGFILRRRLFFTELNKHKK